MEVIPVSTENHMTTNKFLLTLAIAAVLVACTSNGRQINETLVCTLRGEVLYKTTAGWFYTTDEGRVWKSSDGYQYRPGALESCYTRRATAEEMNQ